MKTSLRPETQRKYAGKEQPWYDFLLANDLLGYVTVYGCESAEFRRILIWFLYHLAVELKYTESQVNTTLQALQHSLRLDGLSLSAFHDSAVTFARKATREDARTKNIKRSLRRRLPVTFDMLDYLEELLLSRGTLDDHMILCGLLLGFHFMLRASEYCKDGDGYHALRVGDIIFLTRDSQVFHPCDAQWPSIPPSEVVCAIFDLRSSKADKIGRGRHLYLDRTGPAESRFLSRLIFWSRLAQFTSPDQYFLSHASRYNGKRKHLTRRMITATLKRMALHFGFDEVFFSSHSLRIGGHSCGTAANLPNPQLTRIAGWLGDSETLYRSNVPDRGVLSALHSHSLDTKVTLLSSHDVRRMIPTAFHKRLFL